MFSKILVPTDGSEVSVTGALRAVPLAKMASARIVVVFVQDLYPFTGIGEGSVASFQEYTAAARAQGTEAIERIVDAARAAGVAIETLIVEDTQAARGIVSAAKSCAADLIVMGSHGRSGVARLVLGSVAAKVLALSSVPVLIIKASDDGKA